MLPTWIVPSLSVIFICSVIFVAAGNLYLRAIVAEAVENITFFPLVSPWIQACPVFPPFLS